MIYEMDEKITIRSLRPEDAQVIAREEVAQGWVNASPKSMSSGSGTSRRGRQLPWQPSTAGRLPDTSTSILPRSRGRLPGRASRRLSILGCWQSTATAASAAG